MVANFRSMIFGMLWLTIAIAPASLASRSKLEPQELQDREISSVDGVCWAVDRRNRKIFTTDSGTRNALIKLNGAVINIKRVQALGGGDEPEDRFTAKGIEVSIVYGRGKSISTEAQSMKYSNAKFNVTYKGRRINIPVTGYCSC